MFIDSYTDLITMKATNGRRLYLTEKDGKITWTYHRKFALQFHPSLGIHKVVTTINGLSIKDREKLKISRAFTYQARERIEIEETYTEYLDRLELQGVQWINRYR